MGEIITWTANPWPSVLGSRHLRRVMVPIPAVASALICDSAEARSDHDVIRKAMNKENQNNSPVLD
jgi:hypothetical protein